MIDNLMTVAAREEGLPLTVETCHHYLNLTSEEIPDRATQYKCCPPIRETGNQVWSQSVCSLLSIVV